MSIEYCQFLSSETLGSNFLNFFNVFNGLCERISELGKFSLDYGLLEKTERAWIYPTSFGWQDVGTWESLYNFIPGKDRSGNALVAENTLLEATSNTLVISKEKKKLIAIKGLEDFMVIDTDDVLVICPKDDRKFKDFISGIAMPDYEKYR